MMFKKNTPTSPADLPAITSEQSTVPSENVSNSDVSLEKEKDIPQVAGEARSTSSSESRRKVETTGLDEAKALDKPDDEEDIVYPTGAKLASITFALCISVFLLALDNTIIVTAIPK
jgi:MFS transporter, DHA2 family, glioxin efflux transporter